MTSYWGMGSSEIAKERHMAWHHATLIQNFVNGATFCKDTGYVNQPIGELGSDLYQPHFVSYCSNFCKSLYQMYLFVTIVSL